VLRRPPFGPAFCPSLSSFDITVTGNNLNPATFDASLTGTDVAIGAGSYSVDETVTNLPSNTRNTKSFSTDCSGTISAGETKTCTITNTITIPPTLETCDDDIDNDADGAIDGNDSDCRWRWNR
jgi:hypothetical protein